MYKKHKRLLLVLLINFLIFNIFRNIFNIFSQKDLAAEHLFYDGFEKREKEYENYKAINEAKDVTLKKLLISDIYLNSIKELEKTFTESDPINLPSTATFVYNEFEDKFHLFENSKDSTLTYSSKTKVVSSLYHSAEISDDKVIEFKNIATDNFNNNQNINEGDNIDHRDNTNNWKNENLLNMTSTNYPVHTSSNNNAVEIIKPISTFKSIISEASKDIPVSLNNQHIQLTFADNENTGKVNIYYYEDICGEDSYALTWNPLFPRSPFKAEVREIIDDNKFSLNTRSFRKITGYLLPLMSDWYTFELSSRLGAEFILFDKYENFSSGKVLDNFLLRTKISKNQILKEEKTIGRWNLFKAVSEPVFLESQKKYLYDITNVWTVYGMLQLKWKASNSTLFSAIPSESLFPLYEIPTTNPVLPNILYFNKTNNEIYFEQDKKNNFFRTPSLNMTLNLKECAYSPTYIPNNFPPDFGTAYVRIDSIYPDHKLLRNHGKHANISIPLVDNQKAEEVMQIFLEALNGTFTNPDIVHIEENKEEILGKRYFVEVDVINSGSTYRSSGWFFKYKNGSVCKPSGYVWRSNEKIYLLTPVKNQSRWFKFLVDSLNHIITTTGEKSLHLIVVDYESNDGNVSEILTSTKFPYTLLLKKGNFSKVKGLNAAVKSIIEDDALMFVLDLQIQIPLFLFDSIRKHTFKGQTTYVPVMLRLGCGQHPFYTEVEYGSIWQEIGYGMISIFKSDWNKIGGMDEKRFGERWGGEDWELIDRVLKNKIEVIHHRIPGYYHLYHSTRGTWDGSKLF
ncbi:uncharacterized protein LOC100206109 [Hydra vulgaris]|uniref:Hexosyltransferase n=1 Tax=Hydra vulgaris TaxID=6087 RepID=A0ABM4CD07_HYDVU